MGNCCDCDAHFEGSIAGKSGVYSNPYSDPKRQASYDSGYRAEVNYQRQKEFHNRYGW
jgi:hypothetical protein